MQQLRAAVAALDQLVWGIPLIGMIVLLGVLLTIRLRGLQLRHLGKAFRYTFHDEAEAVGEVSSFGALCTALAATIGTGNIVGVATAICAGGPGALFWMIVTAFFGMATKYAEGVLAVKYRVVDEQGHARGGPFYYIERGMGRKFRWLGKLFAVFTVMAGILGIGTITQVHSITSAVQNFFDPQLERGITLFGTTVSWTVVISGLLVTVLAALVLIGGIRRISKVAEFVVPFMAISYIAVNLLLLVCNFRQIPAACRLIFEGAFNPRAVTGGVVGSIFIAIQTGVARGVFTNESGLGSAPIAAAAARTKEPVRQGLVSMLGTFIDTIVLCTMTGLSIVLTGAWNTGAGLEGVAVTTYAFQAGLPFDPNLSAFLLMVCLIFFAFATIIGWNIYVERCLSYLAGKRRRVVQAFQWAYILAVLVGPYISLDLVWGVADITNGLMAVPNLIAMFSLSGVVVAETKLYFAKVNHVLRH